MTDPSLPGAPAPRPEPKRDRWGRYIITHPHTGKSQSWTRATTFASSVADTYGLTKWQLRMTAVGLAQRSDLFAQVASGIPLDIDNPTQDEKKRLDALCESAKEHAGTSRRANLGTALHSFCEAADLGRDVPDGPWKADVDAYRAKMSEAGITIDPAHVERIVTVPELDVAGTFDRIATRRKSLIADLKSGRDLSYSWGEIAIQLALYAHAETIYDPATETHEPMPQVDQTQALVMHVPAGTGTCTLWLVDIAAGWEMAQTCLAVRNWRKRKNLAQVMQVMVPPAPQASPAAAAGEADVRGGDVGTSRGREATTAPAPSVPERSDDPTHIAEVLPKAVAAIPETTDVVDVLATFEGAVVVEPDPFAGLPDAEGAPLPDRNVKLAWLTDQYEGLKKMGDAGLTALQAHWPADLPTLKKALEAGREWGHDELARIEAALKAAGNAAGALLPDIDPTDPTFKRVLNSDARVLALLGRGSRLPKDLQGNVASAARTAELPSLTTGYLTEAHLPVIERIVADAEAIAAEWASEVDIIVATAGAYGLGRQAVLAVFGATDVADINGDQLPLLDVFANALCVAGAGGNIFAEREGRIIVDRPADVLDLYMGDRQRLRKCAREYAKQYGWPAPAKADDALADVLITACLLADV